LIDSIEWIGGTEDRKAVDTHQSSSSLDKIGLVQAFIFILFHGFVFFHDPRISSYHDNRKGFNE
jgi:hypothetical protein